MSTLIATAGSRVITVLARAIAAGERHHDLLAAVTVLAVMAFTLAVIAQ